MKIDPKHSTGYEGEPKEEEGIVHWMLEREQNPFYSGVQAYIKAGGETRGMVRLKNEKEFEWLSRKIRGDFDPRKGP